MDSQLICQWRLVQSYSGNLTHREFRQAGSSILFIITVITEILGHVICARLYRVSRDRLAVVWREWRVTTEARPTSLFNQGPRHFHSLWENKEAIIERNP